MKTGYIYRMISPSLKAYIGQTVNSIEQRHWMYKHPETMRGQRKLKRALLKYGYDAFTVEVFEVPRSDLSLIETLIIAQEDSFENGYNGTEGGEKGNQKLDSELKYGVRESDDRRGYRRLSRKAKVTFKYAHMNEVYPTLFSAITEEPTMAKEIAKKTGMSLMRVSAILTSAVRNGAPIKCVEMRDQRFRVRRAYYFPSAEESERDMKVAKLTEVECPKMRVDLVSDEKLERTECPKVWGDVVSDEELRELAKGHGWRARDARRILKMRAAHL